MANLNFTKTGSVYVAEATINGESVIHLERTGEGKLIFQQSHVNGGAYSEVKETSGVTYPSVVDLGIIDPSDVYPVYLKIISETGVTSGSILP